MIRYDEVGVIMALESGTAMIYDNAVANGLDMLKLAGHAERRSADLTTATSTASVNAHDGAGVPSAVRLPGG